jgi:hypothetical protein
MTILDRTPYPITGDLVRTQKGAWFVVTKPMRLEGDLHLPHPNMVAI